MRTRTGLATGRTRTDGDTGNSHYEENRKPLVASKRLLSPAPAKGKTRIDIMTAVVPLMLSRSELRPSLLIMIAAVGCGASRVQTESVPPSGQVAEVSQTGCDARATPCCTESECERACRDGGVGTACLRLAEIRERWRDPDPQTRIAPLRQACEQDVLEACFLLGEDLPRSSSRNSEAEQALSRACDGGVLLACRSLGGLLNDEVEERSDRSRQACDGGDREACLHLGVVLHGARRLDLAESLLRRTCELGSGEACLYLADSFSRESPERRITGYRLACQRNVLEGCYHLGAQLSQGALQAESIALLFRVCESDHARSEQGCLSWADELARMERAREAARAFRDGCEQGDREACHRRGLVLRQLGRDEQALEAFDRACQLNRDDDCFEAGEIARRLGQRPRAEELYRRACCACRWEACQLWGGELERRDAEQAVWAYARGCDSGDTSACSRLGFLLRRLGRPEEAVQPYRRACRVDDKACHFLVGLLEDLGRGEEANGIRQSIPGLGYE
jgi:TPR repeat protein